MLEAGPALQALAFLQDSGLEPLPNMQQTLLLPVPHVVWKGLSVVNPQEPENAVVVKETQTLFC